MLKTLISVEMREQNGQPVAVVEIEDEWASKVLADAAMDYADFAGFVDQAQQVRAQMAWRLARFFYASHSDRSHFMAVDGVNSKGKTLCGKLPPDWSSGWSLVPSLSDKPASYYHNVCKTCLRIWQKQHPEETAK